MPLLQSLLLSALLSTLPLNAIADEMRWHDGLLRLGYETVELPQGEKMGLLGGSYLLEMGPYGHLGMGFYGAVEGERGGFFTGGIDGGLHFPLGEHLRAETGLFVGGGGGGSAPQGGGLMLRPYLGIAWQRPGYLLGVQFSEVNFPNGDISSRQLGLTLSKPIKSLFAAGWLDEAHAAAEGGGGQHASYSLVAQTYLPLRGTRDTAGKVSDDPVSLLGFEWERGLQQGRFATLAAAGAGGGKSDGYAEVLAGLGWRTGLTAGTALKVQLRAGAAGGGQIDTGGGLVGKLEGGLEWFPGKRFVLGLNLGRMAAADGDFSATLASANFGYRFTTPSFTSSQAATFSPRYWQLNVTRDSYLLQGASGRKPGSPEAGAVDLMMTQIDSMLDEHFLLSGSAGAAYDGDAGGYAVGLVGAGWYTALPFSRRTWLRADAQLGVSGGGGLDVGGGGLLQAKLGVGWELNKAVSLQLGWGRTRSMAGSLDTDLLSIGVAIRTTTLHGEAMGTPAP